MIPHSARARRAGCTAVLLLGLTLGPVPVVAQVGHDPASSPYRDIRHSTFLVFSGGQFFGGGGTLGVAPHDGSVFGLRMSFMANRTIQINGGAFYGLLERNVYHPLQPPGNRLEEGIGNDVLWIDGSIHFNLTGGKSWKRLAPFAGSAIGLSFSESLDDDPADFDMGTKFYLAPLVGVRFFLSDRAALQLESRFHLWQIKYSGPFSQELISQSEWSFSPWINLGLAWAFDWPF